MGRRVLRRHIWGYSVCLCPIKGAPGLNELMHVCGNLPHKINKKKDEMTEIKVGKNDSVCVQSSIDFSKKSLERVLDLILLDLWVAFLVSTHLEFAKFSSG